MTVTQPEGTGFEGTIGYVQWSIDMPVLTGIDHGCSTGWATTPVAGASQTVQVSAGVGFGWGITVQTPTVTLQLPAPTTATWYLVGWVITWTESGGTIALGSQPVDISASPPAPQPGKLAMIPVAHVQVSPGSQMPTQIIDRRQYGSQVISAPSLSAICWPGEGDIACVGGSFYRRSSGAWVPVRPGTVSWNAVIPAPAQGGAVSANAVIPSQAWVFPVWSPSNANTLVLTTSASSSNTSDMYYRFPATGLYSVSWNFAPSPANSGSLGIFRNPAIASTVTMKPTGLYRKVAGIGGTAMLEVRDTSVDHVFAYQNTSSGNQNFALGDAWLQIVRIGDIS